MATFKVFFGNPPTAITIFVRPSADDTDGGWTNELDSNVNLFASIDEVSVDDADYIKSESDPVSDTVKIKLETIVSAVAEPFIVRYRYKKSGTATIDLTARLIQGTTNIAEWAHTDIGTSFITAEQSLTAPQFASITDFTDLYIGFTADVP